MLQKATNWIYDYTALAELFSFYTNLNVFFTYIVSLTFTSTFSFRFPLFLAIFKLELSETMISQRIWNFNHYADYTIFMLLGSLPNILVSFQENASKGLSLFVTWVLLLCQGPSGVSFPGSISSFFKLLKLMSMQCFDFRQQFQCKRLFGIKIHLSVTIWLFGTDTK